MALRLLAWMLALLLAPLAASVNPTDADGGSSGDAGDAARFAKAIAPGTFSGRLTPPVDFADYYSFHGQRGQVIRGTFTSTANPATVGIALTDLHEAIFTWFLFGGEGTFLLPYTGTYLLSYNGPLTGPEITYQFAWRLETTADFFASVSPLSWQTAEASWTQRTTITAYAWTDRNDATTDPTSQFVMVEWFGDSPGRIGWFGLHYSTTGTGRRVLVSPVNAGPASQVTWNTTAGSVSISFNGFASDYGSLRVSVYNTDPRAHTLVSLRADAPFQRAQAAGDSVVTWSDGNADVPQTMVPGYASTSPRDLSLNVNGRFIGDFDSWGQEGWATSPTGQQIYGSTSFVPLAKPGTWRFHLGQTSGTLQQADRLYLDGVFAPALGLAKQWTCGNVGCTAA